MKDTDKITFRLSPATAKQLVAEAKIQGVSPHLYARALVEERLSLSDLTHAIERQAQEVVSVQEGCAQTSKELKALTTGLIRALEVLFVQSGIDKEEAQAWLDDAFLGE
jgi:hypothetical protein